MRYADTCLLISLFYRDAGSEAALAWLEQVGKADIIISHWSEVEFVSAAGIMARRGDIDSELHREGLAHCRQFIATRLRVESALAVDFERASLWLEAYTSGLRAADALHLSIAARLGATLCSADKSLLSAARDLNLAIEPV